MRKITLVTAVPRSSPPSALDKRQPVAEVRSERTSEDVRQPEREHGVGAQPPADDDRRRSGRSEAEPTRRASTR